MNTQYLCFTQTIAILVNIGTTMKFTNLTEKLYVKWFNICINFFAKEPSVLGLTLYSTITLRVP